MRGVPEFGAGETRLLMIGLRGHGTFPPDFVEGLVDVGRTPVVWTDPHGRHPSLDLGETTITRITKPHDRDLPANAQRILWGFTRDAQRFQLAGFTTDIEVLLEALPHVRLDHWPRRGR